MSRAYRIRVSESLTRVIRASDHVSTQLELLDILPREEMAGLLTQQLLASDFEETEEGLQRKSGDVTITVDPASGTVTVRAEVSLDVELETEEQGFYDGDFETQEGAHERLREQARRNLEDQAQRTTDKLQGEATDQLEAELVDLQSELAGIVNRATAEALKLKASRIGQIKELTEDPATGSMTIVLEV